MWLITRYGFFTVVCPRKGVKGGQRPIDTDRVMVRARSLSQLDALCRRFPQLLADGVIKENRNADYRWRLKCSKSVWSECVKTMSEEINYRTFEAVCFEKHGAHSGFLRAIKETWAAFFKLQELEDAAQGVRSEPKHPVRPSEAELRKRLNAEMELATSDGLPTDDDDIAEGLEYLSSIIDDVRPPH